jgi:ketosteroid isomerase-like protein
VADGVLLSGYEALEQGDVAPLLALLADDFEWEEPALPGYPLAGLHRGAEGLANGVLAPLAELLEGLTFSVKSVMVDSVLRTEVATGVMRGRPAGAADEWELPFAHVWELGSDGLAVRAVAYFDRSRLTLAASRRQLADVADELLDQAAEIRAQWSRLGDALRAAGVEAPEGAAAGAEEVSEPVGAASARLAAVDMAQDGASREEVDAYLREELAVEDTGAILDEVFPDSASASGSASGSGSASDAAPVPGGDPGELESTRLARLFARNRS